MDDGLFCCFASFLSKLPSDLVCSMACFQRPFPTTRSNQPTGFIITFLLKCISNTLRAGSQMDYSVLPFCSCLKGQSATLLLCICGILPLSVQSYTILAMLDSRYVPCTHSVISVVRRRSSPDLCLCKRYKGSLFGTFHPSRTLCLRLGLCQTTSKVPITF